MSKTLWFAVGCCLLLGRPCCALEPVPFGYWLTPDDFVVVSVAQTNGIDFMSSGGYLRPFEGLVDHKEPTGTFLFVLSNTPNQITVGTIGTHPTFDAGHWVSPIHYDLEQARADGVDITEDLIVSGTWNGRECFTTVPGDANYDCAVDFTDFLILAENYGQTEDATWLDGDFDWDKQVTFLDFLTMANAFGTDQLANAAVPEPSSVPLCLCLFAAVIASRRTRRACQR